MKRSKKGFLACILLILILVSGLCGCQTSTLQEEMSVLSEGTGMTGSEMSDEDSEKAQEVSPDEVPQYIDEAYVDANYGAEEEEDLSRYRTDDSSGGETSADDTGRQNHTQNGSSGDTQADEENYYTDPVPEGKPQPVEPQDEIVNTDNSMTCSLYVECSTILNNMDDLTEGKESLIPEDGVIYGPYSVIFYEGESVYDILLREMQNNRIHMEAEFTAMYNSAYVEGINNLYEKDCGRWSGWMYCVNDWYPNYGCSRYQIQDGDVIEWHYTCDLGRDLGQEISD